MGSILKLSPVFLLVIVLSCAKEAQMNKMQAQGDARENAPGWMKDAVTSLETSLVESYGEGQRPRLARGLKQVSRFWRISDGDRASFEGFVRANFARDPGDVDTMFHRFERMLEMAYGHLAEIGREFRQQTDLDAGPIESYDQMFAGYDPSAHLNDDFFSNKLAFVILLNFPLTTLEERLTDGEKWSRRRWAETRLAEMFSKRIPAEVNLAIAKTADDAGRYVSGYNIWMHHLLSQEGERLFPPKMRLLSHWNLRDEIKANYETPSDGLKKQRIIAKVMEHIIDQTIPASVIDNPQVDWNPYTNDVLPAAERDSDYAPRLGQATGREPEPNTRYAHILETYRAAKLADPYSPDAPTLMARRFDEERQIPEVRVRRMLETVLGSPLGRQVAELVKKRLGRPLEPFDIWYDGFRPKTGYTEQQLDAIVAKKYPSAEAFERDIPELLMRLGFPSERSHFLADRIVVDAARGSGHALGAAMREAKSHLRTRVERTGMNYKGFNIAVHEMGHNVEQVFSLDTIDYYSLSGVPNTAFTEALAFVFQGRDLELLGLRPPDERAEALKALNDFWATREIAGVAMVDIGIWHWMYEHPKATPRQLETAALEIARDIWNKFYAEIFGVRDVILLGIYSHMIDSFLYLPDYPIGHMIACQLEEHMKKSGAIGPVFERVARQGRLTPDLWMKEATGAPVGPEALLAAAEQALASIGH